MPGASKTRYRCRNRYRDRVYKFIDYRSADSDSDYDYENYKKYNFLYNELIRKKIILFILAKFDSRVIFTWILSVSLF